MEARQRATLRIADRCVRPQALPEMLNVSVFRLELFKGGILGVDDFSRANYVANTLFYLPSSRMNQIKQVSRLANTILVFAQSNTIRLASLSRFLVMVYFICLFYLVGQTGIPDRTYFQLVREGHRLFFCIMTLGWRSEILRDKCRVTDWLAG